MWVDHDFMCLIRIKKHVGRFLISCDKDQNKRKGIEQGFEHTTLDAWYEEEQGNNDRIPALLKQSPHKPITTLRTACKPANTTPCRTENTTTQCRLLVTYVPRLTLDRKPQSNPSCTPLDRTEDETRKKRI